MISFQLVDTQQSTTESSTSRQFSIELIKKLPSICILAPPQVKLNKVYLAPLQPEPLPPQNAVTKQLKINHCKSSQSISLIKSVHQHKNGDKIIKVQYPQHHIAIDSNKQINVKYPSKINESLINKSILSTKIENASSEFQFTRKNKKYNMPRDQTFNLTVFRIQSISPFNI